MDPSLNLQLDWIPRSQSSGCLDQRLRFRPISNWNNLGDAPSDSLQLQLHPACSPGCPMLNRLRWLSYAVGVRLLSGFVVVKGGGRFWRDIFHFPRYNTEDAFFQWGDSTGRREGWGGWKHAPHEVAALVCWSVWPGFGGGDAVSQQMLLKRLSKQLTWRVIVQTFNQKVCLFREICSL